MTIFQVLLRLIKHFTLMDTEQRRELKIDVEKWEDEAKTKTDKLSIWYTKIHTGVFVRLLLPFAFFVGVKYFNEILSDPKEEDLFED